MASVSSFRFEHSYLQNLYLLHCSISMKACILLGKCVFGALKTFKSPCVGRILCRRSRPGGRNSTDRKSYLNDCTMNGDQLATG